jgi:hypothetical protein
MNKITNAEEFLAQRYEVCKGREQKWQLDDMYRFAKEALCFARYEEYEKAIQVYKKIHCLYKGEMDCRFCSVMCYIRKFKELLNK